MSEIFLIVDLQNDFLPGGALPVKEGDTIIPIVNDVQKQFSRVVATKDWHPPGHISFAKQHQKQPGGLIDVKGMTQELWDVHCMQNQWGAAFPKELNTDKIEKIFYKGTDRMIDSYSAFFDNAHSRSTGLGEYLRNNHIQTIYVAGVATDYCVLFSVLDARSLGFDVYVVLDGCRGIDLKLGDVDRAIDDMKYAGAVMTMSNELYSRKMLLPKGKSISTDSS